MKTRPILFNSWSVRAILDERKTQTRRPIKPQPVSPWYILNQLPQIWSDGEKEYHCPFGVPGDLLWVRETWGVSASFGSIKPRDMLAAMKPGHLPKVTYKADGAEYYRWRPSIFMPRWASRLTLRVLRAWRERVQDITTRDIIAEGILPDAYFLGSANRYRHPWINLWNSINARRGFGWASNPYVWVVEFEVAE